MLRLRRPDLPDEAGGSRQSLSADLASRASKLQEELDQETAAEKVASNVKPDEVLPIPTASSDASKKTVKDVIEKHWGRFKSNDNDRFERKDPSIKELLIKMSSEKCCYCEAKGATNIEHHWPKKPAPQNESHGSHNKTFKWENFLYSYGSCNTIKGSNMEWIGSDEQHQPKLLDPSKPGQDPLNHFKIQVTAKPGITLGDMEIRAGLSDEKKARAVYTKETLGLNARGLPGARAKCLNDFATLRDLIDEKGITYRLSTGTTLQESLRSFLDRKQPYLAPIRQMLQEEPALRDKLLRWVPELEEELRHWALPTDDSEPDAPKNPT